MIYCVVPRELESELYDKMLAYYADNPNVTVIVDRRLDGAGHRRRLDGAGKERRHRLCRYRSGEEPEVPALPAPERG